MNNNSGIAKLSNYGFLRLLVSTIVSEGKDKILENNQLERHLYEVSTEQKYDIILEEIRKETLIGEKCIDLTLTFETAYAWGLLTKINDSDTIKSIINLTKEEADKYISQIDIRYVKAMSDLCCELEKLKLESLNLKKNKI